MISSESKASKEFGINVLHYSDLNWFVYSRPFKIMLMGSVGLKGGNSWQYYCTYRNIRPVWGRIPRNTMELTLRITALAVGRQVLKKSRKHKPVLCPASLKAQSLPSETPYHHLPQGLESCFSSIILNFLEVCSLYPSLFRVAVLHL